MHEVMGVLANPANDQELNELGQPVGARLSVWQAPASPSNMPMRGRYCDVVGLDVQSHGEALYAANAFDKEGQMWTYLPYGPFSNADAYLQWLASVCSGRDPLFFAVVDAASERAVGIASYLRITPAHGVIEIGHLAFSPQLQRTAAATEAIYLMLERAFSQGYRRCEWKCNALNKRSRSAATRLGFSFEGIFRQAAIVKERNRDTAWYALLDSEWPLVRAEIQEWLAPTNFDQRGLQRSKLVAHPIRSAGHNT
jgi:RimJ/RimL family protein N-acetyltransferase